MASRTHRRQTQSSIERGRRSFGNREGSMTAEQSNLPPGGDLLDGEWLSTEDLATLLGVDSSTIRRWRTAGRRRDRRSSGCRHGSRCTARPTCVGSRSWLPVAPSGGRGATHVSQDLRDPCPWRSAERSLLPQSSVNTPRPTVALDPGPDCLRTPGGGPQPAPNPENPSRLR
jgi:hypothetical protein